MYDRTRPETFAFHVPHFVPHRKINYAKITSIRALFYGLDKASNM